MNTSLPFQKWHIRPMNPSSLSEIETVATRMRETLIEVIGEDEGRSMYSMEWLKDRVLFHLDPQKSTAQIFLCEASNGEIAGHCIIRVEIGESEENIGLFSTTYVLRQYRSQGIAEAFLLRGETWMLGQGVMKAVTNTSEANTKLINLYKKHGYKIVFEAPEKKMIQLAKPIEIQIFENKSQFGWEGNNGIGEQLIQEIITARKTATACPKSLCAEKEIEEMYLGVGRPSTVIDKHGNPRCNIKINEVFETTFGKPDHRLVEGEGFGINTMAFQEAHRAAWENLITSGKLDLRDDTVLIVECFTLLE